MLPSGILMLHLSFLKRFPLFIWLLFAVSWCLISTLTAAGRGDLLFRFASSVQSCYGEGGALQADIAVCGEHSPRSGHTGFAPTGVSVLSPSTLLRLPAALYGAGPALSAVPVFISSTTARIRLRLRLCLSRPQWPRQPKACPHSPGRDAPFPSAASGPGSQRLALPLSEHAAPSPSAAPARAAGRVSGSLLNRNRGLFAGWEGVASLGLSLPLAPPPASYLQRGWAGSPLQFLSPLVLRTAVGVFWPVNFSSLSHSLKKPPSNCSQGLRPVLTLSNAARSSPFRPLLLAAGAGVWGTFLLGVAFRHVICGPYLISPPS